MRPWRRLYCISHLMPRLTNSLFHHPSPDKLTHTHTHLQHPSWPHELMSKWHLEITHAAADHHRMQRTDQMREDKWTKWYGEMQRLKAAELQTFKIWAVFSIFLRRQDSPSDIFCSLTEVFSCDKCFIRSEKKPPVSCQLLTEKKADLLHPNLATIRAHHNCG